MARPLPRRGLAAFPLAATLGLTLTAQGLPPREEPIEPRGQLIDAVIAYVGDKVILRSSVWSEIQARINAVEGTPTRDQILAWRNEYVIARHREEALAQSARTMRGASLDQVEQIFEQELEDYRRRQVERAGSVNRYTEELGVLGKTWGHVYEERRTETLAQLAEQQAWSSRVRDRWALLVTPKRMRAFYEANIEAFVQEGSTDLEIVSFLVRSPSERTAAREKAEELAAVWAETGATAEEMARRFDATATVRRGVRNTERDQTRREFKEFAAGAEVGTISAPMAIGDRLVAVVRVARRSEARDERFSDPAVQARIQEALIRQERLEVRGRLIEKSIRLFPLRTTAGIPLTPVGRSDGE